MPETAGIWSSLPSCASREEIPDWHHAGHLLEGCSHLRGPKWKSNTCAKVPLEGYQEDLLHGKMFKFACLHLVEITRPCWSFPEKPKRFCFRLFPHGIIWSVSNTPYVFVFLYGRKRRFACRTLRTGSNICFRQIVRRPASICCSCARLSTNSTCT